MPEASERSVQDALAAAQAALRAWLAAATGVPPERVGAAGGDGQPWISVEIQDLRLHRRVQASRERDRVALRADLVLRARALSEPVGAAGLLLATAALRDELDGSPQCTVQPASEDRGLALDVLWPIELAASRAKPPTVQSAALELGLAANLAGVVVGRHGPLEGVRVRHPAGTFAVTTKEDGAFRLAVSDPTEGTLEVLFRQRALRFALAELPRDERGLRISIDDRE